VTKPIRIGPYAEQELAEAVRWYEQQRPALGGEFLDAVARALERVARKPDATTSVAGVRAEIGARRFLLRRFPYSIVLLDRGDHLYVVAVAHTRRRPGYWRRRV